MIDFTLNNKGDITLERKDYIPKLKISFRRSLFLYLIWSFYKPLKLLVIIIITIYVLSLKLLIIEMMVIDVVNKSVIDKEELKQTYSYLITYEQMNY